jgi:MFS family permease
MTEPTLAIASSQRGTGTTAKGVTLVAAQILPVMAIVSLFAAIPKLFAHFGAEPHAALLVPMIVTMPSLCVALFAPMTGALADRFGRRVCFLGGMTLYVVAGLAPLVLNTLQAIVASRAVFGVAEAFVVTVSSALIGDYFGEQRYRWVSWVGAATSIAGTVLILVGGALADVSWRGPFAIYALAIPVLILASIYIDEPIRPAHPSGVVRLPFPWREAGVIGSVTLAASLIYYVEPLNIATVLVERGARSSTEVGLIQGGTSLAYVAGAFLYRQSHSRTIGQLLGLAGALMGIGLIAIGLSGTSRAVTGAAAIQQLGAGMVIPALLAWAQATLPTEQRGRGMGIWATAFFSGTFLCAPLVTWTALHLGNLATAMLAFGGLSLALALAAVTLMGRKTGDRRARI